MDDAIGKDRSRWYLFTGEVNEDAEAVPSAVAMPPAPPWRAFRGDERLAVTAPPILPGSRDEKRAKAYRLEKPDPVKAGDAIPPPAREVEMINAALFLRRPLLITGKPGTGKSSLAYAAAWELGLGEVLYWPITTRSTLKEGLYDYDAIGRLQAVNSRRREQPPADIGTPEEPVAIEDYITLGPLGTALLPSKLPRVLLIDEIDKGDIDLPNDLLNIFEEGKYTIPELARLSRRTDDQAAPEEILKHPDTHWIRMAGDRENRAPIYRGRVQCLEFPLVIMTSNGERDFPGPFLRRCLRLRMELPLQKQLERIVEAHFAELPDERKAELADLKASLVTRFLEARAAGDLATDQLLNAAHIRLSSDRPFEESDAALEEALWTHLSPEA